MAMFLVVDKSQGFGHHGKGIRIVEGVCLMYHHGRCVVDFLLSGACYAMGQDEQSLKILSHKLIDIGRSAPPIQSYNRQILRVLMDAVEANAATLWLVRENELILSEEIEEKGGAVQRIRVSEQQQQQALRQCFEKGESVALANSTSGSNTGQGYVVLVPVSDIQGVRGVVRVLLGEVSRDVLQKVVQLSEVVCGYYSLYSAQRLLSLQQEERQEIDKLSKAILQLQHYTFSHQLPEVLVNSALEIAPVDRVVLLSGSGSEELRVESVSSVIETDKKGAWTKLVCELGEVVLARGEPAKYFPGQEESPDIEDEELRRELDSYAVMTDVKSLLVYPLTSGNKKCGVLIYERFSDQRLTKFEQILCTVFATHAASALGNHRLFDSIPLSGMYAKRIHKEQEEVKRGPFRFGGIVKFLLICAVIAAIGWFVGIREVKEKVSAQCFVEPLVARTVTAAVGGEVEDVKFQQGEMVEKGALLIKLRTRDIRLSLRRAQERAENIRAQMVKLRGEAEDQKNLQQRGQILAELQAKRHELRAKEEEVKLLQDKLEQCFLHAPISGVVIEPEEPHQLLGVTVREGEPLCRVGQVAESVKVKVAIPGDRISEVETGQNVQISLRPFIEQRVIEGTLQQITSRSVTYKNSNVFMGTVVVARLLPAKENPGNELVLQPGMTGKAKVVLPGDTTYASIYGRLIYRKVKYWMF
jgi:multidrug resistance efflux pump